MGPVISFPPSQPCCCSTKAATDHSYRNACDWTPVKLYLQKWGWAVFGSQAPDLLPLSDSNLLFHPRCFCDGCKLKSFINIVISPVPVYLLQSHIQRAFPKNKTKTKSHTRLYMIRAPRLQYYHVRLNLLTLSTVLHEVCDTHSRRCNLLLLRSQFACFYIL